MLDIFSFFVYTSLVMKNPFYEKLVLNHKNLIGTDNEERFKSRFLNHFAKVFEKVGISDNINSLSRIDHYTNYMLYEFKFNERFETVEDKAIVLAQSLYYIHHIYVGKKGYVGSEKEPMIVPAFIACVSMHTGIIVETKIFEKYYTSDKYDWDIAASNAICASENKNLVYDLISDCILEDVDVYDFSNPIEEHHFIELHNSVFTGEAIQLKYGITKNNLKRVFNQWMSMIGDTIAEEYSYTTRKMIECFLSDMYVENSHFDNIIKTLTLDVVGEKISVQCGLYEKFWKNYDKIDSMKQITHFKQHADRLISKDIRQLQGAYYTPVELAERAVIYMEKELGEIDWDSGRYRIYDPAGGVGNLISILPKNAYKYCYLSTLEQNDVDYCSKEYEGATCFQYDYTNDDIEDTSFVYKKMPSNFVEDLKNPEIIWIIFVNPPYGSAPNPAQKVIKDKNKYTDKKNITSNQKIREWMITDGVGKKAAKEFYCQFIFRICKEFENKNAYLGIFSTAMYVNGSDNQILRDTVFRKKFINGFMFYGKRFNGVNGEFPIQFCFWNLNSDIHINQQSIICDVVNNDDVVEGYHVLDGRDNTELLTNYFTRPARNKWWVGFTGGLNYTDGSNHSDPRNRIADGFLFSVWIGGDTFKSAPNSFISSAPCMSAGGCSVTKDNFREVSIAFAVKQAQTINWLNANDMFYMPLHKIDDEFYFDCVVYNTVNVRNYSSSINKFLYKDEEVRIVNNTFPFTHEEVSTWECYYNHITKDLNKDTDERFVASVLSTAKLSEEAKEVMTSLRNLYKYFYLHAHEYDCNKWKIKNWDVGFYQVRNALPTNTGEGKRLKDALDEAVIVLKKKIAEKSKIYGFVS